MENHSQNYFKEMKPLASREHTYVSSARTGWKEFAEKSVMPMKRIFGEDATKFRTHAGDILIADEKSVRM